MAIEYTNLSYSKTIQNLPKLGFLVCKFMYHLATLELPASALFSRIKFNFSLQRSFQYKSLAKSILGKINMCT
jgi:hypothetical protein